MEVTLCPAPNTTKEKSKRPIGGLIMRKPLNEKNFVQWSDVSEEYNDIRPKPPLSIIEIILSWLQRKPDTIVDVGCGTGLSAFIWNGIAKNIIGIEPNDDMRAIAEKNVCSGNIIFRNGFSNETGLPSDYADVITVSQAFHWMDIDSTLAEFYRILKQDGVLAIYDHAVPPVLDWKIEKEFLALREKCNKIVYSQKSPPVLNDKSSYNNKIKAFGRFRFSREVECHLIEEWTLQKAARFIVHLSNADFAIKMDSAIKKDIDNFLDLINSRITDNAKIIFPYSLVIAVK